MVMVMGVGGCKIIFCNSWAYGGALFLEIMTFMGGSKSWELERTFWGILEFRCLFSLAFCFGFVGAFWGGSPVLGAGTHYM